MDKYTQFILKNIGFNDDLNHRLREYIGLGASENQLVSNVVALLCLNTGMSIDNISNFKWNQILYVDSDEEAIVNETIDRPRYTITLNDRIRSQISELYTCLKNPDLNQKIKDSIKYEKRKRRTINYPLDKLIAIYMCSKHNEFDLDGANDISFDKIISRLFGRRVFEVNGYTTEICKKLKSHLGCRTNKDLFDFLGYASKDDISYNLADVNILGNCDLFRLKDKNFNDGNPKHSFQSFNAFNRFLNNSSTAKHNLATISIKLLLMISLNNGIRLSLLLKLKWSNILKPTQEEFSTELVESTIIDGYTIKFNKEIQRTVEIFLRQGYKANPIESNEEFVHFTNKKKTIGHQATLDPSLPIFIMNNFNSITQPSLLRETKKALKALGFKHSDSFTTKSTIIMYGRKVIEIKGNHINTLRELKKHFNLRTKTQLFKLLHIDYTIDKHNEAFEFKRKLRNPLFEEIFYDLPSQSLT